MHIAADISLVIVLQWKWLQRLMNDEGAKLQTFQVDIGRRRKKHAETVRDECKSVALVSSRSDSYVPIQSNQ